LALLAFIYIPCVFTVHAEEIEIQQKALAAHQKQEKSKQIKASYIIETRVQGSQEQPNVIYITPWQENDKAVNIQGQSLRVSLPQLAPVNPKLFKKQLINYYQKQTVTEH
jgi:hypothetical protein